MLNDAGPAFFLPARTPLIIYLDLIDRLSKIAPCQHWYCQPHWSIARTDLIAILIVIFPVLDMVQYHKHIRLPNLIEEPQPREVFRLMDRDDHAVRSVVRMESTLFHFSCTLNPCSIRSYC